jgi:hypothetical protein
LPEGTLSLGLGRALGLGDGFGEMLDPLDLEPGVGDAEGSGLAETIKGFRGREAFGTKEAGKEHAGPADAGVAVCSDRHARPQVAVEAVDKPAELFERVGDGMVGDGKPLEIDAGFAAELGFVLEAEDPGLLGAKEGDEGIEAGVAEGADGSGEPMASGRTGDDGDARRHSGGGWGQVGRVYPIWDERGSHRCHDYEPRFLVNLQNIGLERPFATRPWSFCPRVFRLSLAARARDFTLQSFRSLCAY